MIAREGFGKDQTPDLLYLNYKAIDSIGHIWSADGIEMSDTLKIQDENLKILVDYLNQVVGKDQWNMILTADHGTNRDPLVTGAWRIGIDELTADIANTFDNDHDGVPLIMKVRPTEVWFNMDELKQNGFTLDQVSNYIANLTEAADDQGQRRDPDARRGEHQGLLRRVAHRAHVQDAVSAARARRAVSSAPSQRATPRRPAAGRASRSSSSPCRSWRAA